MTITAQHVQNIKSVIVLARDSGNEADLAGLDITFATNVITLADGTGMDLSADLAAVDLLIIGHNN